MKPEDRVKKEVDKLFECVNVAEVSRRIGRPRATVDYWKKHPESIRAVDLERLKDLRGIAT